MLKLSNYVADYLFRQSVKHVFMLTGGGAMHLNDSDSTSPWNSSDLQPS